VVIGAGNVGMDIACQAWDHGAANVTCVDIQKPASFGKEQEMAASRGTKILFPKTTEKYDAKAKKILFKDGSSLDADLVIISIGEKPVLDFLPTEIHTDRGFIVVNDLGQTTDVKVFAIGDAAKPGLVTHAIGNGKIAADVIHAQLMNTDYVAEERRVVPFEKIKTQYYEVCAAMGKFSAKKEANRCMSCGSCRDCGMCVETCYYGAITRRKLPNKAYEYVVDESKCIGCGFCVGICPCGVWEMAENV
jgi:ferredoxin